MKYAFVWVLMFVASIILPGVARAGCDVPAQNYKIDGALSTPGDGYTVRVINGSARNCLSNETNQSVIPLKLTDTSVDGFTFCTNAVRFRDNVRWFDGESSWQAIHGGNVMGILLSSGALTDPGSGVTMRNRTGGDDMWDMVVTSGYYQVTNLSDSGAERKAHDDCVALTQKRAGEI